MTNRLARLRDVATSLLEVVGAVCIVVGVFFLLGVGAAWIAGGVLAIVAGYLMAGDA